MQKQYAARDLMAMDLAGNYYIRHVSAMTREGLHSKSDIAAELAWRDLEIDRLRGLVGKEVPSQNDNKVLAAECKDFANKLRHAFGLAQAAGKGPSSFIQTADLLDRAADAISKNKG